MKATDAQSKLSLKDPGVQLKDEIQCQCCFCNIFIHFYSCKNQPLSISKTCFLCFFFEGSYFEKVDKVECVDVYTTSTFTLTL